jgi:hypothetical protein
LQSRSELWDTGFLPLPSLEGVLRTKLLLVLATVWSISCAAQPVSGERTKSDGQIVEDAITQPVSDINLKKKTIPTPLLLAQTDPYATQGLKNCAAIISAVVQLDGALGPDLDRIEIDPKSRKRREGASNIAGGIISMLIPFRFLIREATGASQADRTYQAAVYAGVVRRAFLKGLGQQKRCRAPGRPLSSLERAQGAATEILDVPDAK